MSNNFKDYFDLEKTFEQLKVKNDYQKTKYVSNSRKFIIAAMSFGCFLIGKKLLELTRNKNDTLLNYQFRFRILKYKYQFFRSYHPDSLLDLVESYSQMLDYFEEKNKKGKSKLSYENVEYYLNVINRQMLRINHFHKINTDSNNFSHYSHIFKPTYPKIISILENNFDHLITSLDVLTHLFDLYYPCDQPNIEFSNNEEIRSSSDKLFLILIKNTQVFEYFLNTDFEKFYKLKKIIIKIEKLKLFKDEQGLSIIKQIIETEENKLPNKLKFI